MDDIVEKDTWRDKLIPWYFVAFFLVIGMVDAFFVVTALKTHTGVVTEHAYEKGLAYNDFLEEVRHQPSWDSQISYENGILRWSLRDEEGGPLAQLLLEGTLFRPVQGGYDFSIIFEHKGDGVYEASLSPPLQGLWIAKLSAEGDVGQYRTTYKFIVK